MADNFAIPSVGLGVTGIHDLGRTPYTVIEVVDSRTLRIQEDTTYRLSGRMDAQEYRYEANPRGTVKTITMRERGLWYEKGKGPQNSYPFEVGVRKKFQGYSTTLSNLWNGPRT